MPRHSKRTKLAVAAAAATGTTMGLDVSAPKVLYEAFSVVVHLAPSPVVARIPTVLAPAPRQDLALVAAKQRKELDIATWLNRQGLPVLAPSPLTPPEPVQHDGFSMTFWELVDHDRSEAPDYEYGHGMASQLHASIRDYPGDLPFLAGVEFIQTGLRDLESLPKLLGSADLDRAYKEWAILEPYFGSRAGFEAKFPGMGVQTIHGDSPSFNRILTPNGILFADFEEATLGPIEWDLMLAKDAGIAAYNAGARMYGLRPVDLRLLECVEAVGRLRAVACLSYVPQLPMMRDVLAPVLHDWRSRPLAAGLT